MFNNITKEKIAYLVPYNVILYAVDFFLYKKERMCSLYPFKGGKNVCMYAGVCVHALR